MEQTERDDESISTPDATDLVSDPNMNSGAQVGVEAKEKHTGCSDAVWCITFSPDGTRMIIAHAWTIRSRNTQTGVELAMKFLCRVTHMTCLSLLSLQIESALYLALIIRPPASGIQELVTWFWALWKVIRVGCLVPSSIQMEGVLCPPLLTGPFASRMQLLKK